MIDEAVIRTKELADVAKVSERTITRWCEKHIIIALQPAGPGGAWIIPVSELQLSALPPDYRKTIISKIEAVLASR